jgi:hypothetical protein
LTHSDVRGVVAEAGTYRLRLSWSPHWHVLDGAVTLAHDPVDGKIILHATAPGSFRLTVDSGL